ncbi:MAG: transcription elongation factor GreA [Nitrospirae bacterium CG18_big_fil_WC_8_21_14_2_50_70_55]|nr:transcription elongation factor GreA [Deltaproteobacteria bacterium]OIP67812.1 MAG: transcription elongation factor GreA [Nitrospirae bacterium CG2_30_70_394]PIQ07082.1 MAG: transcription elongation factor GreA [Nitrospirae bacterium CG18_big_fil_WC_8_21_14_2_50_70_55]PIU78863.1 MAG: transcription elongation factor GreA [Nitrospirae bacterium CG06_land_8_20_14_3_00_70_43]PIW82386.1 MAG: transcription elongation factor GreA [Nitrospirae bacterium CG_4_8_14_3_um_filter_70_85]PIX82396.1 MAG: t
MSNPLPITRAGLERLKAELHHLRTVERPKNVRDIEEARGHGDLSENADYDAAKQRQGFIEAQMQALSAKIARAQVIDPARIKGDRVVFGVTVDLLNCETEEEISYTLVGEEESDASVGVISITSPVGRALLGKAQGDVVEVRAPRGAMEYEILAIRVE